MPETIPDTPETAEEILSGVQSRFDPVLDHLGQTTSRVMDHIFSVGGLVQLAIIGLTFTLALGASKPMRGWLGRVWPKRADEKPLRPRRLRILGRLILPAIWVLGLWVGVGALESSAYGNELLRLSANLLQAWIFIRLFSTFVRDPTLSHAFAAVAWTIAALSILNLLNPTIAILDSLSLSVGATRISLYLVLKGLLILILLIWFATLISSFVQSRLARAGNMTSSVRTLIGQATRIGLLFLAIMLAMSAIGVDLTALAVFSGAIGVGIGFGLQAIFSNLMAGIILLIEQTVKVGDFIELESGLAGEVREINVRATLITTTDNVDILIPNAEFINGRVINMTLREAFTRIRIPFGVAYGTDKEMVRKAALEAAQTQPHNLVGPNARPSQVWLVNFGDSSLEFELVVWVNSEAVKRPKAVRADYNWAIDSALRKYGIEIPFPQRDLHIRSGSLPVVFHAEEQPANQHEDPA